MFIFRYMSSTNALFTKSYKWMQLGISKWYREMIWYSCRNRRRTHRWLNCGNIARVSRIWVHARWRSCMIHLVIYTTWHLSNFSVWHQPEPESYGPRWMCNVFTIPIFIMCKFNVMAAAAAAAAAVATAAMVAPKQRSWTYRKSYKSNLIFRNDFESLSALNGA